MLQRETIDALHFQKQLWFMQRLAPDVALANISARLLWHGPLDLQIMSASIAKYVERHPYLNCRLEISESQGLVQQTGLVGPVDYSVFDVSTFAGKQQQTQRMNLIRNAATTPLPLDKYPPLKCTVIKTSDDLYDIVFVFNHLTCDGLSMGILCKEFLQAYDAQMTGGQPRWRTIELNNIADYSINRIANQSTEMANPDSHFQLPYANPPISTPGYRGGQLKFSLDEHQSKWISGISRQHNVSPFVTWLSIVNLTIAQYQSKHESVFRFDIVKSGRSSEERRIVGPFFETVGVDLKLNGSWTFRQLLHNHQQKIDIINSAVPHSLPASTNRSRVLIDYQTLLPGVELPCGAFVTPSELDNGAAAAELCIGIRRDKKYFSGHIKYDIDLFDTFTVKQIVEKISLAIDQLSSPNLQIGKLNLLTESETAIIRDHLPSKTKQPGSSLESIRNTAIQQDTGIAIIDASAETTWRDLMTKTNSIAAGLIAAGVEPGDRVGLFCDPSADGVSAILAIMNCAAIYTPLDADAPIQRRQNVIDQADLRYIICDDKHLELADQLESVLPIGDLLNSISLPKPLSQPDPSSIAYTFFTSGSTGQPKGVDIAHSNVSNLFVGMKALLGDDSSGRWLACTRWTFDISILEILWTLSQGFQVIICPRAKAINNFADLVSQHAITHFQCTPSLLTMIISDSRNHNALKNLHALLIGGEALPQPLAEQISQICDGRVFNMYGPTETTVWSTAWQLPRNPNQWSSISIGKPLSNQTIAILNDQEVPLPVGAIGDLWIGGAGVGPGYCNSAAETEKRFIDHQTRGRIYRTGDLAKFNPDGELQFIGRSDDQVKLGGHRFELGDVEAAILSLPSIKSCVVFLSDSQLAAAFISHNSENLSPDQIKAQLESRLPHHMIPTRWQQTETLPINASGKIDRHQSRQRFESSAIPFAKPSDFNHFESGVSPEISEIARLIQQELGLETLPLGQTWNELGINSLDVLGLVLRIEKRFGKTIPAADIFSGKTVISTLKTLTANDAPKTSSTGNPLAAENLNSTTDNSNQLPPNTRRSKLAKDDTDLEFENLNRILQLDHQSEPPDHTYAQFVEPVKSKLLSQVGLDKNYVRGQDCYLWDEAGNRYLDCIAQYGGLPFGYNPQAIWSAIENVHQNKLPNVATQSMLDSAGELAKQLLDCLPQPFEHVVFCNSGAEAIEVAIKLCRSNKNRPGIIATERAFHGLTNGALSATGSHGFQNGFFVDRENYHHIPYGDAQALESLLNESSDTFAAFIVEPIQGEAGIVLPPSGYLKQVREICDRYDVLLVFDEVQTGLGRTGDLFAFEFDEVTPDAFTLAKALGGGLMPMGAVICQGHAYTNLFGLRHSSTFAGNAMASQCGIATLKTLLKESRALIRAVKDNGTYLLEQLRDLQNEYSQWIENVRGRGYMLAIEFDFSALDQQSGLLPVLSEQGILLHLLISDLLHQQRLRLAPTFMGKNIVRIEPPLIFTRSQCDQLVAGLRKTLAKLTTGNTATLVCNMIDLPESRRNEIATCHLQESLVNQKRQPSTHPHNGQTNEFGFLVHLSDIKDLVRFDTSLSIFDPDELALLKHQLTRSSEPTVIGTTQIQSVLGRSALGHFVLVPYTPDELLEMPREKAVQQINKAAAVAATNNLQLIGLGGFTSILTMGGIMLDLEHLPAVTSGNTYTAHATVQAIEIASVRNAIDLASAQIAVVGAAGQIGRVVSMRLAGQCSEIMLVGRESAGKRSRENLNNIADEIKRSGGSVADVRTADSIEEIRQCDIVVLVSSATHPFIKPHHIKSGAIVVDSSRPANVAAEVRESRPDVHWIEGGLISLPGKPDLDLFAGPTNYAAYACVAETVLWALEPEMGKPSAKQILDCQLVDKLAVAADRHGFKVIV